MEQAVSEDIQDVLGRVISALVENRAEELSELSNHVIHDASIFQDEESISFAVLVYALYKTIMRCRDAPVDQFVKPLQDAYAAIKHNDLGAYKSCIKSVLSEIKKSDEKMSLYIEAVITKARIKKAGKIHEHGISLARTAELLGISHWELAQYIGKTTISEVAGKTVKERLAFARKIFS